MTRFDRYGEAELARLMAPVAAAESAFTRRLWGGQPSPDEQRRREEKEAARFDSMEEYEEYKRARALRDQIVRREEKQRRMARNEERAALERKKTMENDRVLSVLTHNVRKTSEIADDMGWTITAAVYVLRRLVTAGKVARISQRPVGWRKV